MGIFVFDGCTNLTNVTIGSGLTSIPNYTFRNCTDLTDLTVYWTSLSGVSVSGSAFNGITTSNVTLHVPCSAIELYQAANEWKDFNVEGEGTYTITVTTDDTSMGSVSVTEN